MKSTMSRAKNEPGKNRTLRRFLSYPYGNIFSFLLIALTAFIVYSNSFDCQFHLDDESGIVNNQQITRLSYFNNREYWLNAHRPLAFFSFALNYHFGKLDVWGYHLVNLLIHIVAGIFVFLLVKLILDLNNYNNYKIVKHKNLFVLLASLFFVVHPLQTQAITYIVQRMASMSAMFCIMSLYFYSWGRVEHVRNSKVFKAILLYLLALATGILGVMTKQNAIIFPFVFLLFEFCFIRSKENKIFKNYIIISLSTLVVVCVSFLFFNREILTSVTYGANINSTDYLINQFIVIVKYLLLVILPINQCADYGNITYGFPYIKSFWRFDVIGCFLLLLGLFTLAVYLFKKNKAFSFGIFWFFLTLSVESSILPIADPMFEHRMYLPMVGVSISLVSSVFMILPKLKTTYIYSCIALLIFVLGILSHSRNEIWKNELTLWTDATENAPNNARAWYSKGKALEELGKLEEAIKSYDKAVEIQPEYYYAWNNKGNVLDELGKHEEAINSYDIAIGIKPGYYEAWNNKGTTVALLGKREEANKCFDKVIEINPESYEAWYNKGANLVLEGKNEEAIKCYDKVLAMKPYMYEAWNRKGAVLEKLGRYKEAIQCYDKALQINPNFISALNNKNLLNKNLHRF
ncbi:MAG: tetratricopeptide repeat protein [Bacteroidota bacterium]